MEPPPLARYIPQNSKKRVFPGSSSSYMDPDVIEIDPPIAQRTKSKSRKQKGVVLHEVIDIDMDEDSADVMLIDDKTVTNNKGKECFANSSNGFTGAENPGRVDGVQSNMKNCALGSHNSINLDAPDLSYGDDDYLDKYYDDLMFDDEYSVLQAHFDNIDIPPGVEASIPWLSNPSQNYNPVSASTSSSLQVQSHSLGLSESTQTRKNTSSININSSSSKIQPYAVSCPGGLQQSSTLSLHELAKSKRNLAASSSSGFSSSQTQKGSWSFPEPSPSKRKYAVSGSTTLYNSANQVGTMKLSPVNEYPPWGSYFPNSDGVQAGNGSLNQQFCLPMNTTPIFPDLSSFYASSGVVHSFPGGESYTPWVQNPAIAAGSSSLPCESVSISSNKNLGNESDILKKFHDFKRFDTVEDHSDHHYSGQGSSLKKPSKNWAKKIQEEWKILEKDLPDTIFVRVYESRMDLLRAVMVGAEGTPYHDGLFFFDIFFPCNYPNVPPLVYYHSGGLRINPNLYNCGKVCLSLLNTWSGSKNEKWIPGVSTILQVLVSIQGLILNAEPFYNEPGYARMSGSANGKLKSQQYSENTFILSLKTMVYTMRRPPKHFEDFVVGHFYKHAHDILVACKAYTAGAPVGCLAKGGVQDVDAGDKSCSQNFKGTLAGNINTLVQAFTQIGAKDCEKFITTVEKGSSLASPTPNAANGHWI